MLARAMNHPANCHGLSKDRARYEGFAELMGRKPYRSGYNAIRDAVDADEAKPACH